MTGDEQPKLRKVSRQGHSTGLILPAKWCRRNLTDARRWVIITIHSDDSITIRPCNVTDPTADIGDG